MFGSKVKFELEMIIKLLCIVCVIFISSFCTLPNYHNSSNNDFHANKIIILLILKQHYFSNYLAYIIIASCNLMNKLNQWNCKYF